MEHVHIVLLCRLCCSPQVLAWGPGPGVPADFSSVIRQ